MAFVSMAYAVSGQVASSVEYNKVVDNVNDVNTRLVANGKGIISYGRRDTSSSGSTSTTAVGVLRLDNISVVAGRSYIINVTCHPNSSVQTDNVRVEVRGTTSGTATTASSVL